MTTGAESFAWLDKRADFDRLAACAALHARVFPHDPWGVESLARVLAMPGAFGLTWPAEGPPASLALARVAADEAELLTLAVAPEKRRQGLGRALVTAVAANARGLGAAALFLEVAATNTPARNLYSACGFSTSGYRPGYYRTGEGAARDAVVLTRRLDDDHV